MSLTLTSKGYFYTTDLEMPHFVANMQITRCLLFSMTEKNSSFG